MGRQHHLFSISFVCLRLNETLLLETSFDRNDLGPLSNFILITMLSILAAEELFGESAPKSAVAHKKKKKKEILPVSQFKTLQTIFSLQKRKAPFPPPNLLQRKSRRIVEKNRENLSLR
ncbi:hypothetical protein CEXT_595851 [Caerostris extrusa]|uniref:Uncharacterized protein n=1 Tax=Caerostris extrusa TaxID=172846 RepID=A0AAV4Y304_CAEEX|nr:hypothetical protein CEXT_595851 [Caerostris extrusa]